MSSAVREGEGQLRMRRSSRTRPANATRFCSLSVSFDRSIARSLDRSAASISIDRSAAAITVCSQTVAIRYALLYISDALESHILNDAFSLDILENLMGKKFGEAIVKRVEKCGQVKGDKLLCLARWNNDIKS